MSTNILTVLNDLVGTKMGEVLGLTRRIPHWLTHRRRQSRAALIEQNKLVVLQRARQPTGKPGVTQSRAGRLTPRTALQEDQVGLVGSVGGGHQTRVHLNSAQIVRIAAIQRDPQTNVIGQQARNVAVPRHGISL